jgi:hypothetical protein
MCSSRRWSARSSSGEAMMVNDMSAFIEKVLALGDAHAVKAAIKTVNGGIPLLAHCCEDIAASPDGWGWCGAIYFDNGTALILHNNGLGQWWINAVSHDMAQDEMANMRHIFENVLPEE